MLASLWTEDTEWFQSVLEEYGGEMPIFSEKGKVVFHFLLFSIFFVFIQYEFELIFIFLQQKIRLGDHF